LRVQYCSDLHLEFEQNSRYLAANPLDIKGDILILAGDIVPMHDEFFSDPFFSYISKNFSQVFWVPGNHEYYYKDISDYKSSFNIRLLGNINIVSNIELMYEGVNFIFSTLWSRISEGNEREIMQRVSDFECISINNRKLRASDFNSLHEQNLCFLKKSLVTRKGKTVVVTHHVPSVMCNADKHNGSTINEAFCVDLTSFIERSNADFWIFGHSHYNQKPLIIGKTIMVTNQLGYVHLNEYRSFKKNAYFAV